jgi:hypothetical protein
MVIFTCNRVGCGGGIQEGKMLQEKSDWRSRKQPARAEPVASPEIKCGIGTPRIARPPARGGHLATDT